MATEIIYATHATSTDNEAGIATGWLPGALSAVGRKQAAELGIRCLRHRPNAVFVSDLARAVQTAEIAFGESDIPIHQDSRLRECNYGRLNGMPVEQIAAERGRRIDEPFPEGQSYRQVAEQTRDFLRHLAADWDESLVVIVAHSANRWALQHLIDGAALEDLVDAPFDWQPGWRFVLPREWADITS